MTPEEAAILEQVKGVLSTMQQQIKSAEQGNILPYKAGYMAIGWGAWLKQMGRELVQLHERKQL